MATKLHMETLCNWKVTEAEAPVKTKPLSKAPTYDFSKKTSTNSENTAIH